MLGLAAAVAAGYVPVKIFLDMPAEFSLGALPGWVLVDLAAYLGAGLVLLLGALATLFRATAGAVLLGLGALLAIGALLTEPLSVGVPLARFADAMFTHGGFAMADRVGPGRPGGAGAGPGVPAADVPLPALPHAGVPVLVRPGRLLVPELVTRGGRTAVTGRILGGRDPNRRPAAVAAAVLALLGGLVYLAGLVLDVVALLRFPGDAGRWPSTLRSTPCSPRRCCPAAFSLLRRQPAAGSAAIAGVRRRCSRP